MPESGRAEACGGIARSATCRVLAHALLALAAVATVGCGGARQPENDPILGAPEPHGRLTESVAGLARSELRLESDALSALGTQLPLRTTVAVYSSGNTTQSLTVTVGTYASDGAALAAYNDWFATYGFMPALERFSVEAGEQAEMFTLDWPPVHAVTVREGPVFALIEASPDLPSDERRRLLSEVAQSLLPRPFTRSPE